MRVVPAFDVAEDGEPRFDMRLERRKRIAGRSTASRASACSFQSSRPRRLRHGLQRSTLRPGTARKNLCALSSFVRYQRTIGALDRNPREVLRLRRTRPGFASRAPDSKAITRNRYDVVIEQWAKPYLERHLALHDVIAPSGEVIAAQLGPAYRAPGRADLWLLSADDGRAPGGGAFVSNTRRTATATTTSANSVFLTCNC